MATTDIHDKKSSCVDRRRPVYELFDQEKQQAPQISKKAVETMHHKDQRHWLSRLQGSAKLKKFTKEEQEHWYDDYEHRDLSDIFRKHGLD